MVLLAKIVVNAGWRRAKNEVRDVDVPRRRGRPPHIVFATKELLNIFNDLCSIHVVADGVAVPASQILRHLRRLKTGGSLKSCPTNQQVAGI
jgi:hypothetical protein